MAKIEEPPSKRARTDADAADAGDGDQNFSMEDIFGEEVTQSGLDQVLAPHMMDQSDVESHYSQVESHQEFIVDDPEQPEEAGFGLNAMKLSWVSDIFGDTSVLKPLGEIDAGEEAPVDASVHASLGLAEAAVAASLARDEGSIIKDESQSLEYPLEDALDPDVLEKSYQLPADRAIAKSHLPERWLQTLAGTKGGVTAAKTDQEYQEETIWMYYQIFQARGYEQPPTAAAIIRVLAFLHDDKLEMIYIVEHLYWKVAKALTKEDLWKIQEYDILWQPIWSRYLLLTEWVQKLEESGQVVPEYMKYRVGREVWKQEDVEGCHRDAHAWLRAMYPTLAPRGAESLSNPVSSVDGVMKMARRSKFDEKLGIVESLEVVTLRSFGITPNELGDNLAHGKQIHASKEDEQEQCSDVCSRHIDINFPTWQAVRDAVTTFLVRLISSEPRVRDYVRKEFWKHCVISAKITEAGRPLAKEAAHSFKQSYRGFHVTYRPVSRFDAKSDLFLEMMQLQSKGLIKIEYDLMVEDTREEKQKLVMPYHSYADLIRIKQNLAAHWQKRNNPEENPIDVAARGDWNECEELLQKLEAVARLKEAGIRRAATADIKSKVTSSYKAAGMNFQSDALRGFLMQDPIFEKLSEMYCYTEEETATTRTVPDLHWNNVRRTILRRALCEELYPAFWAEVQDFLVNQSSQVVCDATRIKLTEMLDMKPVVETDLSLNEAEEKLKEIRQDDDSDLSRRREDPMWQNERIARKKGLCSVLVILPEAMKETSSVAFVNAFGEAVDMRSFFTSCMQPPRQVRAEKGSFAYDKELKVSQHREELKRMLADYKPAVVLLAITDPNILRLKNDLESYVHHSQDLLVHFKVLPKIHLVDTTVPRAVAYNKRVVESPAYRDYREPSHRIAISCARYHQDALAEAAQLWHEIPDENGLLRMPLSPLQKDVPTEMLNRTITRTLQEVLAKTGLQINKVRRSAHMSSLIQFLPGLGPRKAKLFMKTLANSVKTRQTVVDILSKQLNIPEKDRKSNPVIKNMLPFIKIEPDFRDSWEEQESPSLDRLRIPPTLENWVTSFCRAALEGHANDLFGDSAPEDEASGDSVARVIRLLQEDPTFDSVIKECDWANWATSAGEQVQDCTDLDKLFDRILEELSTPFQDLRQSFTEVPETELFYLAMAESSNEFRSGCVVRGSVLHDEEYPEKDTGKEGYENPKVVVSLAGCGRAVRGMFRKAYTQKETNAQQSGHIPGCDRQFRFGEPIMARVRGVKTGRYQFNVLLSVDQDEEKWFEGFPVAEDDLPYFLPNVGDDWTKVTLGLLDNTELKRKAELKDWVRRPRNIKHPQFIVGDHLHAVEVLHRQMIGFCLFRSSKHYDVIFALLKVKPTMSYETPIGAGVPPGTGQVESAKCFRQFDIFEQRPQKTYGQGFEVANKLEVDGKVYCDFDEIIARHMEPIISNLKKITQHKHYGLNTRQGKIIDETKVQTLLQEFSKESSMLNYKLLLHDTKVGHGALYWTIGGRNVKQELLEVYADGYRLLGSHFSSLKKAVEWFKSTGWRNASKLRQDARQEWRVKSEELTEKRGLHADPDAQERRKKTLRMAMGADGLKTPGGLSAAGTPFQRETNARTPYGLMSNAGTPAANTNPPTPANPPTPSRGRNPQTPAGAFERAAPATPWHLIRGQQPSTPNLLRGQYVPQTPVAGTPSRRPTDTVPQTPVAGTPARGTPSGSMVPQTPLGAFQRSGTPNLPTPQMVPQTPAAAFSSPAGAARAPQTPAAAFPHGAPGTPGTPQAPQTPVPQTPAMGEQEVKMDPGTPNIVPTTPAR